MSQVFREGCACLPCITPLSSIDRGVLSIATVHRTYQAYVGELELWQLKVGMNPTFVWSNSQQQSQSFYESCVFDVERMVNVLSVEQEDRICRAPVFHRDTE